MVEVVVENGYRKMGHPLTMLETMNINGRSMWIEH
jgi:hypothetical protein